MAKVLVVQPFHEDGMKLLEARGDVTVEIVDGALEELVLKSGRSASRSSRATASATTTSTSTR
jgi:hypothetical protein